MSTCPQFHWPLLTRRPTASTATPHEHSRRLTPATVRFCKISHLSSLMAAVEEVSEPLKYKTWVLKVSIHCEGCRKKVKKVLQNIDGVYTTTIDSRKHKVTVTGNVEADTLIKKLIKTGKHAELWPENQAKKPEKSDGNQKEKEDGTKNSETKTGCNNIDGKKTENSPAPDAKGGENGGAAQKTGGGSKKKKKKGQKGHVNFSPADTKVEGSGDSPLNNSVGFSPPRQHVSPFRPYETAPYVVSYNTAYPSSGYGESYCTPYAYSYTYPESYDSDPTVEPGMFSEDGPSGCSVM